MTTQCPTCHTRAVLRARFDLLQLDLVTLAEDLAGDEGAPQWLRDRAIELLDRSDLLAHDVAARPLTPGCTP